MVGSGQNNTLTNYTCGFGVFCFHAGIYMIPAARNSTPDPQGVVGTFEGKGSHPSRPLASFRAPGRYHALVLVKVVEHDSLIFVESIHCIPWSVVSHGWTCLHKVLMPLMMQSGDHVRQIQHIGSKNKQSKLHEARLSGIAFWVLQASSGYSDHKPLVSGFRVDARIPKHGFAFPLGWRNLVALSPRFRV